MSTPSPASAVTPEAIAAALAALREGSPLVQCLTNTVVTNWTANVLLAAGAAPAMIDNEREAAGFAGVASGVLVNLGTLQPDTVAGMFQAVHGADGAGTPWVLDPVGAGAGLPWRTDVARDLVDEGAPAIVRGNASEILGLTGGQGGRGVDSSDTVEAALDAGAGLARERGCVVAISGPVDHLTDGETTVRLANGHPWLTAVTGVGCSLGGLMAGFAGVVDAPLVAAAAATSLLCVAAEDAAEAATGPGSFAVGLLDRLHTLSPDELAARVRLS